MLNKIVSGGQSGVDRAALDAALDLGMACGGWCPRGRLAEDGAIDDRYPLRETPSDRYIQRTRWNIRDADATLIINRGELSGGTLETFKHAQRIGKPVYLHAVESPDPGERLVEWCRSHSIKTLNIAGPRESKNPGIYDQSYSLLRKLIPLLRQDPSQDSGTKGRTRHSCYNPAPNNAADKPMVQNNPQYQTLIDADTLAQHLDHESWAIFDCRFSLPQPERGVRAYQESHIPGAVYADLDKDLSSERTAGSGRHPLPDAAQFSDWLGTRGVGNDSQVVAYDDAGGAIAARLWWLLRWLGHNRVAVLDGGWQAWEGGGHPVTAKVAPVRRRMFAGKPDTHSWLSSDQVAAARSTIRLLDARAATRFSGESEPIDPVAGHIPGAVNLPFDTSLDSNGRFLARDALRDRFAGIIGDTPVNNIVHMCGSGVTACHNLLAMEHAGFSGSRLYVGSWSEWITDPERPVATGGK